jgi:hypothetical protein
MDFESCTKASQALNRLVNINEIRATHEPRIISFKNI